MKETLETLKKGKEKLKEFSTLIGTHYLVDGKTPDQWRQEFTINIGKDPNIEEVRRTSAALVRLINIASFYKANAQLVFDGISHGSHDQYLSAFEKQVDKYKVDGKRLPSQKTLESLAESSMKDLNSAKANAGMKLRFWKDIVQGLVEQRKSLEMIMWSINIEMKKETY